MKRLLAAAVLAMATAFGGSADAATLGLPTTTPTVTASGSFSGVNFFGSGDYIVNSAAPMSSEISLTPGTELSMVLTFPDLMNPAVGASGSLALDDLFGSGITFLSGSLINVGFVSNTIELLFGNLTGNAASNFGPTVLATIVSDDFGAAPFTTLNNNFQFSTDASITIANVVPLPGAVWLMISGFAGFAWIRRRKTASV